MLRLPRSPVCWNASAGASQLALAKGMLEDAGVPFFVLGQIATLVSDVDGFLRKWLRLQAPRSIEADAGRESGRMAACGLVQPGWRVTMPCCLLAVILFFPRVALALMWIFSTYLQRAFHGGLVLPILGFIFLPLTTIVYAWEINSGMPTAGINLVWLLLAVIIDLGGLGGGAHRGSRR